MTADVIPLGPARDAADQAYLRRKVGFSLLLPLPPSENDMYEPIGKGRKVKSAVYLAWIKEAGWSVNASDTCVYDVPVQIHIYIRPRTLKSGKPDINRSDGPNFQKALFDLLTPPKGRKKHGMGLIPDDSMAWLKHGSFTVVEHDDIENAIPPGWCRMVVKPIAKPEDEE